MAFDLFVRYPSLPKDLSTTWVSGFARHGFTVEIIPNFDAATWNGGFLPFRVLAAPAELIGFELPSPAVSGFEVWFEVGEAHFRSASGRPTTEFAMQCFGAAILAELTGGSYRDPQSGETQIGVAAIQRARREVIDFVASARPHEKAHHAFPGWSALG